MLILCILAAAAVFCFGLPACLERVRVGSQADSLVDRIDQEQQSFLDQTFEREKSRFRLARILEKNEQWMQRACEWTGVDRKKTEQILLRLRWPISLVDIVLFRGVAMVLIASSLLRLLVAVYTGQSLGMDVGMPLLISMLLYIFPTLLLESGDKRAKAKIQAQVPVFFSIVQSLVEAGMPLQAAVKQTAKRFDALLGHEMARLEMEEKRFGNWRKALEAMAYRWEVDALTTIAMEMNEAIRKGVSISNMLAVQVEEQLRLQEDEASAHMNRLNIRLLPFVIVLMGLPLLFLVMGPIMMGISQQM
ncbi:type II secretion system F family protein [Brevibacillus panacihumi]|uniref:Type II secretion system F family protein n=1 Tax=Brevibacillus panacihumi TaxID=497735 RepID=A0A3M8CWD2_9BACL|nr:type II secretion system F family protein [Brevibacillus panacihumi]RNB79661.1 type II secretion system F family protein [Brevibacillus panacihumi]